MKEKLGFVIKISANCGMSDKRIINEFDNTDYKRKTYEIAKIDDSLPHRTVKHGSKKYYFFYDDKDIIVTRALPNLENDERFCWKSHKYYGSNDLYLHMTDEIMMGNILFKLDYYAQYEACDIHAYMCFGESDCYYLYRKPKILIGGTRIDNPSNDEIYNYCCRVYQNTKELICA